MTATLLDGRALAKTIREEVRTDVVRFEQRSGYAPTLAVVQVAGDAASERYLKTIRKACDDVGIGYLDRILPTGATQLQLERTIAELSDHERVHGILLQFPLPSGLSQAAAIAQIHPQKDVDGVHPANIGMLMQGLPGLVPNTPAGGMELLRRNRVRIAGARAVVVGRSITVGKPMALMLLNENATVTIAHSRTPDLAELTRQADIVVAAVGKPGVITGAMLNHGATVIDFGINVLDNGSMVGDVDFTSAVEVVGAITPVPGGTGPMTNVMLLRNMVLAADSLANS
jgi:methylenetetrahydrofolate dehydrogenase (NADP+)/methenyltetrahydrofolate cyclohydrolase